MTLMQEPSENKQQGYFRKNEFGDNHLHHQPIISYNPSQKAS